MNIKVILRETKEPNKKKQMNFFFLPLFEFLWTFQQNFNSAYANRFWILFQYFHGYFHIENQINFKFDFIFNQIQDELSNFSQYFCVNSCNRFSDYLWNSNFFKNYSRAKLCSSYKKKKGLNVILCTCKHFRQDW